MPRKSRRSSRIGNFGTIKIQLSAVSLQLTAKSQEPRARSQMIRLYKGIAPVIPATCYVDESAQIIGDVVLGEHASVWMNAVVRGDVHEIRIGAHSNIQDCSVLHGMKNQYGVYLGEDRKSVV